MKMLPVIASLVMGSMIKQATAGAQLGQLLDSEGYSSVMDDIPGMAGRFLR